MTMLPMTTTGIRPTIRPGKEATNVFRPAAPRAPKGGSTPPVPSMPVLQTPGARPPRPSQPLLQTPGARPPQPRPAASGPRQTMNKVQPKVQPKCQPKVQVKSQAKIQPRTQSQTVHRNPGTVFRPTPPTVKGPGVTLGNHALGTAIANAPRTPVGSKSFGEALRSFRK